MTTVIRAKPITEEDREAYNRLKAEVAKRLVLAREMAGNTRMEWSHKYHVIPSKLHHWETGRAMPDLQVLIQIARDYRISLDYLLMGRLPGKALPEIATKGKAVGRKQTSAR